MFNVVGLPIVESCMMGYNASIFAYGMTGAGKTFTMLGSMSAPEQRGLAPRIFEALFQRIAEAEDIAVRCCPLPHNAFIRCCMDSQVGRGG
ncbi:hypothetical protein WJX84_006803 [Apatococcus fuscideae]|uniref:Kinesin motor domain-containing protein n=1 Tax=Apatococcus fuscideae TaxID=2026836 RepID=A0AAW1T9D8_9CHLO